MCNIVLSLFYHPCLWRMFSSSSSSCKRPVLEFGIYTYESNDAAEPKVPATVVAAEFNPPSIDKPLVIAAPPLKPHIVEPQ